MKNAKRLRGWKKDMDLGADTEGETPSTSSAPSNLATKLLSLWAHGKLSAVEVQKLSNLATLDGCSHPEVATLGAAEQLGILESSEEIATRPW